MEQADLDDVQGNWGKDSRKWPSEEMALLGSGPSEEDQRASFLAALDESLAELGMEEVWDALSVNEPALFASDKVWDSFIDDLAAELDSYYGIGQA